MKDKFKVVENFPKEGINFIDINSVLNESKDFDELTENIIYGLERDTDMVLSCSKIVCIESRGFILGSVLAYAFNKGLVLIRKTGKLPGDTIRLNVQTEYSNDQLEIQVGSIKRGDRVIIHDDILATGGSARSAKLLVEALGGIVVGFSFIGEIESCKGREELLGTNIHCLYQF